MNNQPINTPLLEKQLQRKPVRSNVYSCPQGHRLLSFDMDRGVTPMMLDCHCGNFAKSHFYDDKDPVKGECIKEAQAHQELNSLDNPMPHIIWFGSTCDEDIIAVVDEEVNRNKRLAPFRKRILSGLIDHVNQGGLLHFYTPRYTQAAADSK